MAILISVALLFVGIGVLVIIHTCIVGRAFRRGFTNSDRNNTVETSSFGSRSMSRDEIEKLPRFDFRGREKGSSPVDCAVCLDNFKVGDKCRLLPLCSHSFHAECIDLWLLNTPICPVCRSSADIPMTGSLIPGEENISQYYNSETTIESRHVQTTTLADPDLGLGLGVGDGQAQAQAQESSNFVAVSINEDRSVAIPQGQ